jgi:predicted nucleotidyltransferase component of viral defense system
MVAINKHKFFLVQLLKDIYSDPVLAINLGFKGGTALMFFYDLPRFSVDLDFNLLDPASENSVYPKLRQIVLKYGTIHDEAQKHYGPLIVLDYGKGERKLKLEVSKRNFSDHYEIKDLLGISVKVMTAPDMFAHKLCALLDRADLAPRDVFDAWFLMNNQTPVNKDIVEHRMQKPFASYLEECIDQISAVSEIQLISGLGELLSGEMKTFVKTDLKNETLHLLRFYKDFPILV